MKKERKDGLKIQWIRDLMESDREIDNILQFYYASNYPEYKNICWWWSHNLSTQSSERRLIPYNDSSSSSKGQSYGDGSDESMG